MIALITMDWLKKYSVMYLRRYFSSYARKTDLTDTTSINELAPILKAENISKTYFSLKPFGMITALKNLTLNVQRGKCQGLLGINGAGKTTSFRILTDEIKPTNGSLERPKVRLCRLDVLFYFSEKITLFIRKNRNIHLGPGL